MKYILSLMIVFLLSSCSEDKDFGNSNSVVATPLAKGEGICPPGTHEQMSYEFNTLRLHRASTSCISRFSICSDGKWVVNCVDDEGTPVTSFDAKERTAQVVGEPSSDGLTMKLYFPIQLKTDPGFVASDFTTFGFDSNYAMTNSKYTIKAGDYIPSYTTTQIIVTVDLVP